ncbi:MAG: Hpt domain-containing protein [Burkholderiaceae bacterium]
MQATDNDLDIALNDLGPLAWVLDEMRKSLDGASKALKRYLREAESARGSELATIDDSHLRIARQQLHQAVGALEMVGLGSPAALLRSMEIVVQRFVQHPELCNDAAVQKVERAGFALTEYLQAVLAGKKVTAVALFPQYRDVQELAGSERIHPADLWAMDLHWIDPPMPAASEPLLYTVPVRSQLDQWVLKLIKASDTGGAQNLVSISLGLAAAQEATQPRIFWKICAAFFEALALGLCPSDLFAKRTASRVLMQYAALSKGEMAVPDRLVLDLLFFCSQSTPAPGQAANNLLAVRRAFQLERFTPVDYNAAHFGRVDPALVQQARKRIATAKESWTALSGGDTTKLKLVHDQFGLIGESLIKLNPHSTPFAQTLMGAIDATARSGEAPSAELAMEVATSVLYLEAAFEELDPSDVQIEQRTLVLTERLQRVLHGGQPQPLESWMEELYSRVSDRQTMGSVVGELRGLLGELEASLDQFFRNPADKAALTKVPGALTQMRGVLSVLGLEQGAMAVLHMRERIEQLIVTEIDVERARAAGTFERLGNNLGSLGFLIDMLNYQPVLAKKLFVFDEQEGELKPLMGRSEPAPVTSQAPASSSQAAPVMVSAHAAPTADEALRAAPSLGTPATEPSAHEQAADDDEDEELRDIFLEEAREVVQTGSLAIEALNANPRDVTEQTTLRRAFHTLKGSSRMVGLDEFGEAAWSMEQLLNTWLADQKPFSDELCSLCQSALNAFGRWVEDIRQRQDQHWQFAPFRLAAETARTEGRFTQLVLPEPMPSPAVVEQASASEIDAPVQLAALEVKALRDEAVDALPEVMEEPLLVPEVSPQETATQFAEFEADFEIEIPSSGEAVTTERVPGDADFAVDISATEEPDFAGLMAVLEPTVSATGPLENQTPDELTDTAFAPIEDFEVSSAELVETPIEPAELEAFELEVDLVPVDVGAPDPVSMPAELPGLPNFEPDALAAVGSLAASAAAPAMDAVVVNKDESDERIKVIGSLSINIALYNLYLNEADEWSRRLQTETAEWALELSQPVTDSMVSLTHSLSGTSATVGFTGLSELARELEHAMLHVSQLRLNGTPELGQLFTQAAQEIRRLLHQFAAGFLKLPEAGLLEQLRLAGEMLPPDSGSADLLTAQIPADEVAFAEAPLPEAPADISVPLAVEFEAAQANEPMPELAASVAAVVQTELPVAARAPVFSAPMQSANVLNLDDDIDELDVVDPDLFPIFEEEAAELFPQLGTGLRQWMVRPADAGARNEVLRVLHTLKGSARLSGAMRLGEMAHRMESDIEQFGTATVADIEPLLGNLDALLANFDSLRAVDLQANQANAMLAIAPAADEVVAAQEAAILEAIAVTRTAPALASAEALTTDLASAAADVPAVAARGTLAKPSANVLTAVRQAANQAVRVRSQLLDRLVNQAGEVIITRSRIEAELRQLRSSLGDLTNNLDRLRHQLRDIEVQSESQMQSRMALAKESDKSFDPLEFDRFTRVQELTRMMAESVNDVATIQRTLTKTMQATEDDLVAQARQTRELQRDLLRTRMVEFEGISDRLYRVVRQASKDAGKQVKLDITGGSIEMDRGVLDRMTPAFEHLLRNCVAHGIESPQNRTEMGKEASGIITVDLHQAGNDVSVEFRDDGAGLNLDRIREKATAQGLIAANHVISDEEASNLIYMPGFSTASEVTELAGRGVGMDVVRSEVVALGGRIETSSQIGRGTSFKLILPLTTAVTQVVMFRAGTTSVGVPANVVELVRRVTPVELEEAYKTGHLMFAGEQVPFYWCGALLQVSARSAEKAGRTIPVMIYKSASQRVALHVDEVLGNQEVVVKNLGPQLARLPGLSGMSVLASGAVVLIYNPVALATVYGAQAREMLASSNELDALRQITQAEVAALKAPEVPLVLVVDDSITVRRVTQRLLQREGYRVALAADGLLALEQLAKEQPTVVLSDIEMPRMDGFDLARNIRNDVRLRDLPIIMITSRIAEKHREHAMELGVNHYLGKPYSEEELLSLVRRYCLAEAEANA